MTRRAETQSRSWKEGTSGSGLQAKQTKPGRTDPDSQRPPSSASDDPPLGRMAMAHGCTPLFRPRASQASRAATRCRKPDVMRIPLVGPGGHRRGVAFATMRDTLHYLREMPWLGGSRTYE
ncbi:hypothetical protein E4U54_001683, partial [Claviceps lovelessii]